VAQAGRASSKCSVESPLPQPLRAGCMVDLSLITNQLLWNKTSTISGIVST